MAKAVPILKAIWWQFQDNQTSSPLQYLWAQSLRGLTGSRLHGQYGSMWSY